MVVGARAWVGESDAAAGAASTDAPAITASMSLRMFVSPITQLETLSIPPDGQPSRVGRQFTAFAKENHMGGERYGRHRKKAPHRCGAFCFPSLRAKRSNPAGSPRPPAFAGVLAMTLSPHRPPSKTPERTRAPGRCRRLREA